LEQVTKIYDNIGAIPIMVVLAKDSSSFFAYERLNKEQLFVLSNDTLISQNNRYNLLGYSQNTNLPNLKKVNAYQEYWHSWQTFHQK
jgi:hypothetical protein